MKKTQRTHVNPMIRKASLEIPTPGTWRPEATSQVSFQSLPTGQMAVLVDKWQTQPPLHFSSRRKIERKRQELQWWPFQGKLSLQELFTSLCCTALATPPLVCLTRGDGLQPHDTGEWWKGSCLAQPTQIIPVHRTRLSLGSGLLLCPRRWEINHHG